MEVWRSGKTQPQNREFGQAFRYATGWAGMPPEVISPGGLFYASQIRSRGEDKGVILAEPTTLNNRVHLKGVI